MLEVQLEVVAEVVDDLVDLVVVVIDMVVVVIEVAVVVVGEDQGLDLDQEVLNVEEEDHLQDREADLEIDLEEIEGIVLDHGKEREMVLETDDHNQKKDRDLRHLRKMSVLLHQKENHEKDQQMITLKIRIDLDPDPDRSLVIAVVQDLLLPTTMNLKKSNKMIIVMKTEFLEHELTIHNNHVLIFKRIHNVRIY